MTEHHSNRWHPIAVACLASLVALFVGGILFHWSWNTLAELFGTPGIQFRHAIASELLIAVIVAIGSLSGRLVLGRRWPLSDGNRR